MGYDKLLENRIALLFFVNAIKSIKPIEMLKPYEP